MKPVRLPFVCTLLASACSSVQHPPLSVLSGERPQEVRMVVETQPANLESVVIPASAEVDSDVLVTLGATLFEVDPDLLDTALGEHAPRLFVWVCPTEQVGRLESELNGAARNGAARRLQEPELSLYAGQTGSISVVNEVAYISAFDVHVSGFEAVADPRIDTVQDGLRMKLRPALEDGQTTLELELACSELDLPFGEHELDLFGTGAPVTLQAPTAVVRTLTASARLGAGEALVLGGRAIPVGERSRALVVLLRARLP